MKFSLEQLRHVLAIDRFRHFGRAAEHLDITQPALSRSVSALEQRMGARLFHRSRRGVEPTRDGLVFLEHGRDLLAAALQLEAEVLGRSDAQEEELALACGLFPASLCLAPALRRLRQDRPQLTLDVTVTDWHRGYQLLRSGAAQLLLGEMPQGDKLLSQPLNSLPLRLVVGADHPLAQVASPTLDQVLSFPWACPPIPPRALRFFGGDIAAGRIDRTKGIFTPAVTVASLDTALELLPGSDLLTLAPLSAAHAGLQDGRLYLVPFAAPWLHLNYGFSWHRGALLTVAAQRFIDHTQAVEKALQQREMKLARHYRCDEWRQAS